MWGGTSEEQERMYRSQFEREGERILFRYGKRAAPVAVTESEMEESVAQFVQRARWIMTMGVAVMFVAIAAFVVSGSDFLDQDGSIWLVVIAWAIPFLLAYMWAWRSPTRHFRLRAPVGQIRTRSEVRAQMLADWNWPKTLLPIGVGLALVSFRIANWPPATIDSWIWLGFGAFFILAGLFNAIIKWRGQGA